LKVKGGRWKVTNRIRIGNQTAFSAASIAEPFRYAVDNGFDAFEWFPDQKESGEGWGTGDIGGKARNIIKKMARAHDLSLSVHAPWQTNIIDPMSLKPLLKQVRFAADIGAGLLNLHLIAEDGIRPYLQAVKPIITRLREEQISLAIENTPLTGPDKFNALFAGLRDMTSEATSHVGMCLDPGHANLCQETLNDYLTYIDRLDPEIPIIHLHLHENYGDHDSHLPLFSGPSRQDTSGIQGLLKRLVERNFSGAIILEQWPSPPSRLNDARDRLFTLLNDI
jgi:sugar phosphate isomerase/epimerase